MNPATRLVAAASACLLAGPGVRHSSAYVVWFAQLDAWQGATVDDSVAVTFGEAAWPVNQPLGGTWTVGNIAFTGLAGTPFPNIFVANFGNPFGSGQWLVANGDENIDIVPLATPTALAFDASANQFGAATIRVFDLDDDEIGLLEVPIGTQRFVGIVSHVPIGRVNFSSVLGALANTGADTVRIATRAALLGDLNGDGVVDGADLGLLISNWGGSGLGDLNCDDVVDGADLGLLVAAWTG